MWISICISHACDIKTDFPKSGHNKKILLLSDWYDRMFSTMVRKQWSISAYTLLMHAQLAWPNHFKLLSFAVFFISEAS